MRIGIDGSLIGILQSQLLMSEVSRCAFLGEQKLQQKHQDSRPYPEPRALPLTLSGTHCCRQHGDRCHEIVALSVSALCDSEPTPQNPTTLRIVDQDALSTRLGLFVDCPC
jgi:hypothetical protein